MARPLKEINWDLVDKYIEVGCNGVEISKKLTVDSDTFYSRFKKEYGKSFSDYSAKFSSGGNADIRLMLHAKAVKGNVTALIFLAKCNLGMREPEQLNVLAANQPQIDQTHEIMRLQHEIETLRANLADKPQTE
jgi:hypothetical protein